MTLGAPTLFDLPPDEAEGFSISEELVTDVQRAILKETRASMFVVPIRTVNFTVSADYSKFARFRDLWLNATERLRYYVPLWCDRGTPTALAGNVIQVDTTDLDFAVDGKVLLVRYDGAVQLMTISGFDASHVFVVETITLTNANAVFPVIIGWLQPPDKKTVNPDLDKIPVSFEEEPPGLAGFVAGVGDADAPAYASIIMDPVDAGSSGAGDVRVLWEAFVYDPSGERFPHPPVVWSIVATGIMPITDPRVSYGPCNNGQQFRFEGFGCNADCTFTITCTIGSISDFGVIAP